MPHDHEDAPAPGAVAGHGCTVGKGPDVHPPGAEGGQYYFTDHPHGQERLDKIGKRYPYHLYDNDPRTDSVGFPKGKPKVYINGCEQERCMGKPAYHAGQVRHPHDFHQTVSGPCGKSFGDHLGAPDPFAFQRRLAAKGA